MIAPIMIACVINMIQSIISLIAERDQLKICDKTLAFPPNFIVVYSLPTHDQFSQFDAVSFAIALALFDLHNMFPNLLSSVFLDIYAFEDLP
jgi:hypothetical protein